MRAVMYFKNVGTSIPWRERNRAGEAREAYYLEGNRIPATTTYI